MRKAGLKRHITSMDKSLGMVDGYYISMVPSEYRYPVHGVFTILENLLSEKAKKSFGFT